ncbi:MFS general substrate transporter [Emericellopsis cladophorae]|uniref:MFS general substrate transporter n=1 Tax=Emericellopsis cladophorae TaxID=2686198 RepID=A0A9Q0BB71_9HYPO|nr:MFS general substrate transporter [Emericellopsis cladophorae]KAI6778356.1 MFS general substrate transporter [Emericellopsis cladophorae]
MWDAKQVSGQGTPVPGSHSSQLAGDGGEEKSQAQGQRQIPTPLETEAQGQAEQSPPTVAPPPNGGYGWVCVLCVAVINAHTWGINSSYGVFLAHYLSTDAFPGATYLQYAFVGGLSISCGMLISPLAVLSTRHFGTHATLYLGTALEAAGLIGASFARTTWHLFFSQGVLFGVGMGFLFVASVGIPPQWFTTRRSLANGISAAGSGFGGLLYSFATGWMLRTIGLAWSFRVLGILAFGVNVVCVTLLRDRHKIIGSRHAAFDIGLFRRVEYLLLSGYGFFSMLGYIALVFSLADYARKLGLGPSQAALVSAILNLGQGLGRPLIGYFSDSVGRINMAALTTMSCAILTFLVWVFAESYAVLVFFALAGGTVTGTFWATIGPVAVEVVGLRHLPSALNLEWLVIVLPCTFSEPIALEIVGRTGSYLGAQLFIGSMYVAAAVCVVLLRGWKIGERHELARLRGGQVGDIYADETGSGSVGDAARVAGRQTLWEHFWKWEKV